MLRCASNATGGFLDIRANGQVGAIVGRRMLDDVDAGRGSVICGKNRGPAASDQSQETKIGRSRSYGSRSGLSARLGNTYVTAVDGAARKMLKCYHYTHHS